MKRLPLILIIIAAWLITDTYALPTLEQMKTGIQTTVETAAGEALPLIQPPPPTPTLPAIDNQGPDLLITSHNQIQPWSHITMRSITLQGTATDRNRGNNGIQSVYINSSLADNDNTASGDRTANWSEVLSLGSGWNKITIEAYDNSPNHNKTQKIIWIYSKPPEHTHEH